MRLNIAETIDGETHAYEGYRTLCGLGLGSCDRWSGHPPYRLSEAPGHRRCTPEVPMQTLPEPGPYNPRTLPTIDPVLNLVVGGP